MSTETTAPFKLSRERTVSLPMALLGSLLVMAALGYAAWSSTRDQVGRNTGDITALQTDARTTREILIRIDENVKDLRRTQRRDTP